MEIKMKPTQSNAGNKYILYSKNELLNVAVHSAISETLVGIGDKDLMLLKSLNKTRLPLLSESIPIILWKEREDRLVLVYGYDFYYESIINDTSVYVCIKELKPDDAKTLAQHQAIMLPIILNFLSGDSMKVKRRGRKRKQLTATSGLQKNNIIFLTGVFSNPKILRRHLHTKMLCAASRLAPFFRVSCETVCRWLADLKLRNRRLQNNPKPKSSPEKETQRNLFERRKK
jgi:hypothetical protein